MHQTSFLALLLLLLPVVVGAAEFPRHPFALVNDDELAALRADLFRPGWKAKAYGLVLGAKDARVTGGVRANADRWLSRDIEIPARGGHQHWFVCADGTKLPLPEDQLYVSGPYRCPACGKTYSGEHYESAMRQYVHHWISKAALDLALVSAVEDRQDYADKSAEILTRYARVYPGPHTTMLEGGICYQSLNEAMWAVELAQAYDLIYNRLSDSQRSEIERFLKLVATGLINSKTGGNWFSWHLSAAGVIGYATDDRKIVNWATRRFIGQMERDLGDDGIWPESIHTYHFFALMAFLNFTEAARHAGRDLYRYEPKPGKSLLSMFSAPLDFVYPDFRLPAINDGWYSTFLYADFYEVAFNVTRDPLYASVLSRVYSVRPPRGGKYALLLGADLEPVPVATAEHKSTNYSGLGISVLRSPENESVLTFQHGRFAGHGHPSKMGITLYANDKLWVADYGTTAYGAAVVGWHKSSLAHNLVVVDGANQKATREDVVDLWLGDPLMEAVRAVTTEAYPGVRYERSVVRVGDYYVVVDRLRSGNEHTYDCYLHSEGEFSFDGSVGNPTPVDSPSGWVEGVNAYPPSDILSACWVDKGSGLAVWVTGSDPIIPIVGKCPAETAANRIPLLIARQKGRSADFISVLFPYTNKHDCKITRGGDKLIISHDGVVDTLTIPEDGGRPEVSRRGSQP